MYGNIKKIILRFSGCFNAFRITQNARKINKPWFDFDCLYEDKKNDKTSESVPKEKIF